MSVNADDTADPSGDAAVTLVLPAHLAGQLAARAASSGRSIGEEILGLLEEALAEPADLRGIAAFLTDRLGSFPVAALTGTRDGRLPARWAQPDGPLPTEPAAGSLVAAHRIWTSVSEFLDEEATKRWFLRHHPSLGGDTPLVAIREHRAAELAAAVAAIGRAGHGG